MNQFDDINTYTTEEDLKYPPDTPVFCEGGSPLEDGTHCGWKGVLSECIIGIDSEGYEYPEYPALKCPKCDNFSITF